MQAGQPSSTNSVYTENVFKSALPIMLGYFPIAVTFGLLGHQQGLSVWAVAAFSFLVFAGSAQFVGITLLGGTSALNYPQLFFTIWLINLRHFIFSVAYLTHVKNWTWLQKLRFFPLLTDENFAVLSNSNEIKTDPCRALQLSTLNYMTWGCGTVVGFCCGQFAPNPNKLGLDFTLTAFFIGIVIMFIKNKSHLLTLSTAIVLMFVFYTFMGLGKNAVIPAALIASTIGWVWEQKKFY